MPCELRAGHQTYWRRFGTGARPAVLLHCSLAHSGAWAGLAGALAPNLQMTAFDLPGHGRSADWDGASDYHHLSTQIAASFLTEPVDLIGHSFGATVALRLAVEQPQKLRSLTLIEPVFFAVAAQDSPEVFSNAQPHMDAVKHALAQGDCVEAARIFVGVWGDGRPWEELSDRYKDGLVQRIHIIEATEGALYYDTARLLASGGLDSVETPTLLMHGAQSEPIIPVINAGLAQRLRHSTTVEIADASHMMPLSHPHDCAENIMTFMDRV